MEVLEFQTPEVSNTKPDPVCPSKTIVLALARDHRGIRAKLLAETLHKQFPEDYHKPHVKFFYDIGWRETLGRLRKASKKWDYIAPVVVFVNKKLIGDDDDFNLFIRQKHFLLADPKKIHVFKNMSLLDKLQMDPLKTYVYFDISVDYRPCGRMIFQMEGEAMPASTNGFLQLCCSKKILLPEGQYKRSKFAGSLIKRIVKGGWIRIDTIDNERVYAKGKYEKPVLTHNRRGTLSMNIGPKGWLSSHIIITLDQHPWMDKQYRAIGTLIDGEHVLHTLENVATTYEVPDIDVVITDNGILYSPNLMTNEGFLTPEMRGMSKKLKAFKEEYKSVCAAYVNTEKCLRDPALKIEPEGESEEDAESGIPASQASLLVSKSCITNFTATQSNIAVYGTERYERYGPNPANHHVLSWDQRHFHGASVYVTEHWRLTAVEFRLSRHQNCLYKSNVFYRPSVQTDQSSKRSLASAHSSRTIIETSKSSHNIPPPTQGMSDSEMPQSSKTSLKSDRSTKSLHEDLGEEITGEKTNTETQLTEPDIQYTYVVPKGMVDMRTGYKTFSDGKRPEQFQKVGIKLSKMDEFEEIGSRDEFKLLGKGQFTYEEPHQRIHKDEQLNYYELSKRTMTQVTPQLLLAWAREIDEDEGVTEIQQAVHELLDSAIQGSASDIQLEGHPLDAVSMEDTTERFHRCLLSLPPQLLQMLREAMNDIFERHMDETEPLVVTGESTSEVKLGPIKNKNTKPASEDVISGIMFSLVDFTKRMIESSTELVPNRKNVDFVTSLIDEVILQKVHEFRETKKEEEGQPNSDSKVFPSLQSDVSVTPSANMGTAP